MGKTMEFEKANRRAFIKNSKVKTNSLADNESNTPHKTL